MCVCVCVCDHSPRQMDKAGMYAERRKISKVIGQSHRSKVEVTKSKKVLFEWLLEIIDNFIKEKELQNLGIQSIPKEMHI